MKWIVFLLVLISTPVHAEKISLYLYNETQHRALLGTNLATPRPIASITKLMTAMVALDHDRNLDRPLRLDRSKLLPPRTYSRREVLEAMLIRSDNAAAEAVAQDYPGGRREFIKAMNRKAKSLSMVATQFDDPSGLSRRNIATANDLLVMMSASAHYPEIREISVKKQAIIEAHYKSRVRKIVLNNTNKPVLFEFDNVVVSKTGFTTPAGWCVAMVVEQNGDRHIVIVLGARNKIERFDKVKDMLYNHINDNQLPSDKPYRN